MDACKHTYTQKTCTHTNTRVRAYVQPHTHTQTHTHTGTHTHTRTHRQTHRHPRRHPCTHTLTHRPLFDRSFTIPTSEAAQPCMHPQAASINEVYDTVRMHEPSTTATCFKLAFAMASARHSCTIPEVSTRHLLLQLDRKGTGRVRGTKGTRRIRGKMHMVTTRAVKA